MSSTMVQALCRVLQKIDRPGSFCVSGSVPAVMPGLEVKGLGPISLPLTPEQAQALKSRCEQAPYGKGEKTIVDTSVRRVWRLKPARFTLRSPDWETFLQQTVRKVQEGLGLEDQKLTSHLYELLLYEPGSFFLSHRDGAKLDRMVATLVFVLPSSFQGGELIVRHEGQEQTISSSGQDSAYRVGFVAFYADCEHEIRPVRAGYRLCLVYNLTLARSSKPLTAPRYGEYVPAISRILHEWGENGKPKKLVVTLEHQYTQKDLTWDGLKGVDRARARILLEAARQAGCQISLALLTLHETGDAECVGGSWGHRGGWYDDDPDDYEMGEIIESSLTAEHWLDADGKKLPIGELDVEEDEVLEPDALQAVDPEEEFEGYTGNAGMTLDRWYRHGAIVLWPKTRHFDVLCDAGSTAAVTALEQLVNRWRRSGKKAAEALRAQCIDFAATIIARWPEKPYRHGWIEQKKPCPLFRLLTVIDEPRVFRSYLATVLTRDASVDLGRSLAAVCRRHGWDSFQRELQAVLRGTTAETLLRNVRLLEHIALARPAHKAEWTSLCEALAPVLVGALEKIDQEQEANTLRTREEERGPVLAGLARSLLATEQYELLLRVVHHALARSGKYPLTAAHLSALTTLQPWLAKNVKKPCPALAHWLASCGKELEALTAQAPQAPTDSRRTADISCRCADCGELRRFLDNPQEPVHRFSVAESRRKHLEASIARHSCDLDCRTERLRSPYTLVCTKNTASYQRKLKTYHEDQKHLATIRAIQQGLPRETAKGLRPTRKLLK